MALDILIVDDEADIRDLVSGILADEGYGTRTAGDSDKTLEEIEARRPSLVILDIWLQGSRMDGLELLDVIKSKHPDLPVVIISGHGTIETAVAAIKRGAYDFIGKPFKADQLLLMVERATETDRLRRENEELRERAGFESELTGRSVAINLVRQTIDKVAPTGSRVLILGPPGSGKEVVARLLHAQSRRANGPFIVVNAASMEPDTLESELFGVEREGSVYKTGVFEQAHGGTLFLDEVSEMPLTTQAKILRVLVDQTFERVGGSKRVQVDVRVVSASSKDLRAFIEAERFREDLYHRLNVVPILVPSLTERREDVPLLAEHFMRRIAAATGRPERKFRDDVMARLQSFDWPGNVRQLRNMIERLLILATDDRTEVSVDMLPTELSGISPDVGGQGIVTEVMSAPLKEAREAFEREYLRLQIDRFGGNISRTASFVGMERSALHRKLKSLGISTFERPVRR
ncbi:nitrogen assimilation response regulator NtrX [Govanella unica]|uniref:Sigma-54 dependent transcriptional regulator n=1 Tax=Govanella unica TaxID=2975056 RepID=A0A9X3Z760_9PROT|nr:sigma-54 dependent transcriptional regulator [Govania unica]MDA5193817.1 sigma-54 dependent transcriptional regulator [Govania unica]